MIRINLLGGSRERTASSGALDLNQRVTLACGAIFLVTLVVIGWQFFALRQTDARLTHEIAVTEEALGRLAPVLDSLAALERQQTRLVERVTLVEQLREAQTGPVRMLDRLSRSVPEGLWLSELHQTDEEVRVLGRAMTLTALSDFVANLEVSGDVTPPIQIVTSQMEETSQGDVVRFELRATFGGSVG